MLGASGTGINPWWRYQEENVPGGGHVMVNVGTGNLLLQDDDMNVAHKGIALAFRRTYNSQSGHDVKGSDGAPTGLYGNGWTNTLDAHLSKSADNTVWSVYDIDGARYDYAHVPGSLTWTPPAGQHATLTYDGSCGLLWTKKSGTIYYFYRPDPTKTCPSLGVVGAYAGRLYQIIGRNTNIAITLAYTWDNPTAAAGSNVTKITATTESGMAATLNFALVAGHNLLQSLVWPGGTTVSYGYDTAGDLTSVTLPPNNGTPPSFSDGVAPVQTYGYEFSGTQSYLAWAASPRWATAPGGCSGDLKMGCGAYSLFRYAYGPSATTTSLTELDHYGFMDPTPLDGTNTPIQPMPPGGSAVATAPALSEYYALGQLGATSTPTFRDSDGHATNWVVDAAGRPGQTQECTTTQNQQCIGTWLTTGETWDGSNNLTAEVDARGYQTDYAYDTNGNTIAVAKPAPTAGAFRPTSLYSYDAFNNVTAFCDPNATHANQLDWTAAPAAIDTLCPQNVFATRLIWSNPASGPVSSPSPAYEPYGQLNAIVTPGTTAAPNGYTRSITYSAAQQGGTDFGLPTSVTGTAVSQNDAQVPTRTPQQTYTYDAQGNVLCYGNGIGIYALQYDALGRRTLVADPDDGSGLCGKATSATRTASYTAYYPDGAVQYTETPIQHAASVAAGTPGSAGHTFGYDLDGDELTESFPSETAGKPTTYTKWYDGTDRLVEVNHGITTRYLYDLTQGGTVSVTDSAPFVAYGNLYARLSRNGSSWIEQDATAFDALDREVTKFRYAYNCLGCAALNAATSVYDDPTIGLGLLASTTDETGVKTSHTYDALGRPVTVAFSDNGVTSPRQYSYDADGHIITATSAVSGTDQFSYDAEGNLLQRTEGAGITSPATYSYSYYPDGLKSALSVQSFALSASIAYAYRADKKRSSLGASWNGSSAGLTWTYTAAGRELAQNDPWGSKTQTYGVSGTRSSLTVPAGAFTNLQYDNEGSLTGMNAYGLTTTRSYDGINELLSDNNTPPGTNCPVPQLAVPPSWATYQYANGSLASAQTTVPNCGNNTLTSSTTSYQSDARAGATGSTMTPGTQPSPPPKFAGSCTNTPQPYKQNSYAYDAAGRQSSSTSVNVAYQQTGICMFLKLTTTQSTAATYDAEGHELQYTQTPQSGGSSTLDTMQWGVNGHPAVVGLYGQATVNLHWDGDDLLFASTTSGALEQFNVEKSLVAQSGSTPIITDRDMSGIRISEHGSAGADGLCGPKNVYGSGSQTIPATCGQVAGALGELVYDRADGLDIGHGTVHGRRTYDAASSQWTVPDAYQGDINDPVSQRPYMWNHNSPYSYNDPSGYVPSFDQAWSAVRMGSTYESDVSMIAQVNGIPEAFEYLSDLIKSQQARSILDAAAKKKGLSLPRFPGHLRKAGEELVYEVCLGKTTSFVQRGVQG